MVAHSGLLIEHTFDYPRPMAPVTVVSVPSLFGSGPAQVRPGAPVERVDLDATSWVDLAPGWLEGADGLLDDLLSTLPLHQGRRLLFDRWVDEPRLSAELRLDDAAPGPVRSMAAALGEQYGTPFTTCFVNHYRSGADSVAWHRDRIGRDRCEAMVAVASLGGPRTFALRPRGGGRAHRVVLRSGDLLVMGGRCQRDWEHAVPKAASAPPRMSVTFRPDRTADPATG
jgi:alkylated DNA repair dioxygenase AlkB